MATFKNRRITSGQFAPGVSGNPGGRPKDEARVAELARSYTIEAINTLVELMRHGKDDRVRGTAAQALLDRGWGKPKVWKWCQRPAVVIWRHCRLPTAGSPSRLRKASASS